MRGYERAMARSPRERNDKRGGMGLVVERSPSQSVMIGDEIEVMLLRVRGERASIGVVAPSGVQVTRGEAYQPHDGSAERPRGS
jgi:carbon storage regulator CsrA